jgi:hypothetical protein
VFAAGLTAAAVLVVLSASESRVAATYRDALEARYAAESALERAVADLQLLAAWDDVLAGVMTSSLTVDVAGAAGGGVSVEDETSRLQARSDALHPAAADAPRWRPFLWAPFPDLVTALAELDTPLVVVAWVADDEADVDGDPADDSNQAVWVRAVALGPRGIRHEVETLVTRTAAPPGPVRRVAWRHATAED